jgi:hypothetical protein
MSQKDIIDAVLLLRNEGRVADTWHSADTIAKIVNVPTAVLNKALSKSTEFTHIDGQGHANKCGVVRFKRKLQLVVNGTELQMTHHFYFFPQRKQPVFHKDSNAWTEIYTKSAQFRLAPRSKQAALSLLRQQPAIVTTLLRSYLHSHQRRNGDAPSLPFDIFNDTKTKTLFNCKNRADLQDQINRM